MSGKLSTGSRSLDSFLQGGFESGIISEIFGEPGSGKTNLVLSSSLTNSAKGKIIYLDTEGVSAERLAQMARHGSVPSNVKFFRIRNYEEQLESVPAILNLVLSMSDVVMVVVDTITAHYRVERDIRSELRRRTSNTLLTQVEMLSNVASTLEIPVLMVNQVYSEKDTSEVKPVGGSALTHMAKAIFKVEKVGGGFRELVVVKHRSLPEGIRCRFRITEYGIE
ncbi:MAG: DNA repair and recombination protein RadB [Thermoplasmatales archaeon]